MADPVVPRSTYFTVYGALIALTGLTVGVSFLHLGSLHTAVGLAIACCKAALVGLFFMHLRSSNRLTWLVISAAFFWMAILMGLTLTDYLTRHWLAY
jgi:cytochrome c oxidase subunit 4